ncbi:MAG TPA: hypothetical protein VKR21_03650 [Solirubrobacteraceae bacterium]|nr:hypothetical protein [Solirubrobacteraceae bacterium]
MGLLDDAIREHLDLKRRRGADPSEVDRLEREALGPVRRAPQEPSDLVGAEETAPAGTYPFDEEPPEAGYAADEDLPRWADAPEESEPYGEHEREPEFDQGPRARHHEIAEEWEAHSRGEVAGEPAGLVPDLPAPAPPPPRPAGELPPGTGSEFEEVTAEHRLDEEAIEEPREGEDVLEETPDFLQDTPDHDRLWFEQRPPRDFDFDG